MRVPAFEGSDSFHSYYFSFWKGKSVLQLGLEMKPCQLYAAYVVSAWPELPDWFKFIVVV